MPLPPGSFPSFPATRAPPCSDLTDTPCCAGTASTVLTMFSLPLAERRLAASVPALRLGAMAPESNSEVQTVLPLQQGRSYSQCLKPQSSSSRHFLTKLVPLPFHDLCPRERPLWSGQGNSLLSGPREGQASGPLWAWALSGAEHWEWGSEAGSAEATRCLWPELGEALAALGPGVRLATDLPCGPADPPGPRSVGVISQPRAVWRRTKNPFSAAVGASVLPAQPEPALPLSPALLNGYKLEDKSAGFQAILPSISGNCRSQSSLAGVEQERRKTQSLLGRVLPQTNPPRGPFSLDPLLGAETKLSPEAGAATLAGTTHIGSCCLLSTYCVPGSEPAMGWWEAGRQTTGP